MKAMNTGKGESSAATTMQVAFRLTEDLVDRLDAHAAQLAKAQPGMAITRTDVVRILLTRALDADVARERRKLDPEWLARLPKFCRYVGLAGDLQHLKGLVLETATVEELVYVGERDNIEVKMPPDGLPSCPWRHVGIVELDANGRPVWHRGEAIPTFGPRAMSRADLGALGWTDALLAEKAKEFFGEDYESDRPGLSDVRRAMFDRVMIAAWG